MEIVPATSLPIPKDLTKAYGIIPNLEDWISVIKEKALQAELDNPGTISGYKAVVAFGHRKWTDEAATLAAADNLGYRDLVIEEPKLKSPAQVEKICKDLVTQETVHKPQSGYKLVKRKKDEVDIFLEGGD